MFFIHCKMAFADVWQHFLHIQLYPQSIGDRQEHRVANSLFVQCLKYMFCWRCFVNNVFQWLPITNLSIKASDHLIQLYILPLLLKTVKKARISRPNSLLKISFPGNGTGY